MFIGYFIEPITQIIKVFSIDRLFVNSALLFHWFNDQLYQISRKPIILGRFKILHSGRKWSQLDSVPSNDISNLSEKFLFLISMKLINNHHIIFFICNICYLYTQLYSNIQFLLYGYNDNNNITSYLIRLSMYH